MIKHVIAGVTLFLLTGVTFAQSPASIAASNKPFTHTITVNALQTEMDTIRISDVFDRVHDRVLSIRYDVPNHNVIIKGESSMKTEDLMEMLYAAGYTSFYTRENKRVTMLSSGKLEATEVK